jgi:hypothetical protein
MALSLFYLEVRKQQTYRCVKRIVGCSPSIKITTGESKESKMSERFPGKRWSHWLMITLSALLIIISVTSAVADDQHFGFVVMGDSRGKSKPVLVQINEGVLVSLRNKSIELSILSIRRIIPCL